MDILAQFKIVVLLFKSFCFLSTPSFLKVMQAKTNVLFYVYFHFFKNSSILHPIFYKCDAGKNLCCVPTFSTSFVLIVSLVS